MSSPLTSERTERAGANSAIWAVRHDADPASDARFAAVLSDDETARAGRFHFEHDRRSFVVSRGVLRVLLGARLGEAPEAIAFATGPHGKPRLARETPLQFNLSHAEGLTLVALTERGAIGVDVERVRPLLDREALARRFFHRDEVAELAALPEAEREHAFFACWTRKEAFLKATGFGLAFPLDGFRVSVRPGEPARVLHVDDDPEAAEQWRLADLFPGDDYVAAVAFDDAGDTPHLSEPLDARAFLARFATT